MENTEGNGGPQADSFGETAIAINDQQLKEKNYISTDGGPQADGEVKSDICYWQKFNYGWHKLKTMCEVLSQCRVMA